MELWLDQPNMDIKKQVIFHIKVIILKIFMKRLPVFYAIYDVHFS